MPAKESTADLFRPQALAAGQRRLWGELLLTQPPGTGAMLTLLGLSLVCGSLLLWWGQFTRTERVHGYLVPDGGVLQVEAPEAGLIHHLAVREGEAVEAGQILLEIRDPREQVVGGPAAFEALAHLEAELDRLQRRREAEDLRFTLEAQGLETALRHLRDRESALGVQSRLLAAESEVLGRRRQALRQLDRGGHAARGELELAELERLQLGERRQRLAAARLELGSEQVRIEERLAALPVTRTLRLTELDDQRSRLERERAEIGLRWRFVLRAPMSGRVAALGVEPGEAVRPGRTLLTLLAADARMHAVLLVPSRAAGFIEPGQAVRLRYAAFPHARFGSHPGEVVRVSASILSPHQLPPPARAEEPVYKVRVRPESDAVIAYGRPLPLQAGMALEADVVLERRRLVHWLLDPLLAMRGQW